MKTSITKVAVSHRTTTISSYQHKAVEQALLLNEGNVKTSSILSKQKPILDENLLDF